MHQEQRREQARQDAQNRREKRREKYYEREALRRMGAPRWAVTLRMEMMEGSP